MMNDPPPTDLDGGPPHQLNEPPQARDRVGQFERALDPNDFSFYGFDDYREEVEQTVRSVGIRRGPRGVTVVEHAIFVPGFGQTGGVLDAAGHVVQAANLCKRREAVVRHGLAADRDVRPECELDEEVIYLGAPLRHYGHFLLEEMARYWILSDMDPRLPVVFQWPPNFNHEPWRWEILRTVGVPDERVLLLRQPTRIRRLIIPEPLYELGVAAHERAADPHRFVATHILSDGGAGQSDQPVYLSRRLLDPTKRHHVGEAQLEEMLRANGFLIVHPETMTVADQIRLVNRHTDIVSPAGSAAHNVLFALHRPRLHLLTSPIIDEDYLLTMSAVEAQTTFVCCLEEAPNSDCTWPPDAWPLLLDLSGVTSYLADRGLLTNAFTADLATGFTHHRTELEELRLYGRIFDAIDTGQDIPEHLLGQADALAQEFWPLSLLLAYHWLSVDLPKAEELTRQFISQVAVERDLSRFLKYRENVQRFAADIASRGSAEVATLLAQTVAAHFAIDLARTGLSEAPSSATTIPLPDIVVYVLGGRDPSWSSAARDFPLIHRQKGEAESAHLARVAELVDEAMTAGGTHLLVPPALAGWLSDHPWMIEYFAEPHEVALASPETGIIFRLCPGRSSVLDAEDLPQDVARVVDPPARALTLSTEQSAALARRSEVTGWVTSGGEYASCVALEEIEAPVLRLILDRPLHQRSRLRLDFRTELLETLRFSFGLQSGRQLIALVNVLQPHLVLHQLPFLDVHRHEQDGALGLDLDLDLAEDDGLSTISIEVDYEINWRMQTWHLDEPLRAPNLVPCGARLDVDDLQHDAPSDLRDPLSRWDVPRCPSVQRPDRPTGLRDAVLFSSYVPEFALHIGQECLDTLHRHHMNSKVFVGVNHGSCPAWYELLVDSGLDLELCPVPDKIRTTSDAAGTVAALDCLRHCKEQFHLVWFGHTNGAGTPEHASSLEYGKVRWTAEKRFWSRREIIEEYFRDPKIGLYTPHNMILSESWLRDARALQRMFPARRKPLAQRAVSTYFVLRWEIVKTFCDIVGKKFFKHGVKAYDATRGFFEYGFPAIASLQGYEPYIEPGLGGTTLPLGAALQCNVRADERQNHRLMRQELERWRADPQRYSSGLLDEVLEAIAVVR